MMKYEKYKKEKKFFDEAESVMNYFNKISKSELDYYSEHEFSFPEIEKD